MNKDQWNHLLQQLTTYRGAYECHLTVDLGISDIQQLTEFKKLCSDLGAKAIVIQLANGATPTQPMLSQFLNGDPEDVLDQIRQLVDTLQQYFTLVRVKVEADIRNMGIPQTDEIALSLPQSCYFEHHVKMQLPKECDMDNLRVQLSHYHGHLSRNAFANVGGNSGQEYRFVTQRFWRGNEYAQAQMDQLLAYLQQRSITTSKMIREFNIFDSHLELDTGWIKHG